MQTLPSSFDSESTETGCCAGTARGQVGGWQGPTASPQASPFLQGDSGLVEFAKAAKEHSISSAVCFTTSPLLPAPNPTSPSFQLGHLPLWEEGDHPH